MIDITLGDRDTTKKHDRSSLLSSWNPEFKTSVLNTFYDTDLFSDMVRLIGLFSEDNIF